MELQILYLLDCRVKVMAKRQTTLAFKFLIKMQYDFSVKTLFLDNSRGNGLLHEVAKLAPLTKFNQQYLIITSKIMLQI